MRSKLLLNCPFVPPVEGGTTIFERFIRSLYILNMKYFIIAASILFIGLSANAQKAQRVVADKIVGIVGDKIILKSDVYNDIEDRKRRGEAVREVDLKKVAARALLDAEADLVGARIETGEPRRHLGEDVH